MTQVISFIDYVPIPRYDTVPWSAVRIEEGVASDGPWVQIDQLALSPLDADPTDPQSRNFTTDEASDTVGLWYRVVFVDAATDTEAPTDPIQNGGDSTDAYADLSELARILKIRTPSAEQTAAMTRVMLAAAGEINSEIDLEEGNALTGWQLALVAEVNLERAVELWRLEETAFGIVGLGSEFGASHIARNTWDKYAYILAPLKQQWGIS